MWFYIIFGIKAMVSPWPIPQPKHIPKPNTYPAIKNPFHNFVAVTGSMTLEEKFEALMKNCEYLKPKMRK